MKEGFSVWWLVLGWYSIVTLMLTKRFISNFKITITIKHAMQNMDKAFKFLALTATVAFLSGCVTQNYENSKTPIVQNESSNTDIAMTRISLGLGYLKMGNTTQAKLNLEKAKRFSPNLVQVYTAFAHYYETVGEDELTNSSYQKALSLKPNDADTLNNYGVFLCRKDRLAEAEQQFLKAIAVPSYLLVSKSYENLALCQLKALNFEKAETYLNKAIDHSPANASILYQMMRLQYAKGQYHQALAYAKRYDKATRRFTPDSLSLSYKIYVALGNHKTASNYGAMLVKMFPESWHARQYLLNELEQIEADELAEQYQLLTSTQPLSASTGLASKGSTSAHSITVNKTHSVPVKKTNSLSGEKDGSASSSVSKKIKVLKASDRPPVAIKRSAPIAGTTHSSQKTATIAAKTEEGAKQKKTIVLKAPKPIAQSADTPSSATQPIANQSTAVKSPVVTSIAKTTKPAKPNDETSTQVEELTASTEVINDNNQQVELSLSQKDLARKDEANPVLVASVLSNTLSNILPNKESTAGNNESADNNDLFIVAESGSKDKPKEQLEDVSDSSPAEYLTLADLPQHKIVKGENLFTISKRYNIYLSALRRWNNLDEHSLIKIGDIIFLADPESVTAEQEQ